MSGVSSTTGGGGFSLQAILMVTGVITGHWNFLSMGASVGVEFLGFFFGMVPTCTQSSSLFLPSDQPSDSKSGSWAMTKYFTTYCDLALVFV